jgi:hypothetical protein
MCGVWCVVAVYLSVYVVKMWCFSVFCFVRVMRNIGIYCERYVSFPYYLYLPPPLHDPRSLLFSSSLPLLSVQFFIFPFLTSLSLNLPLILNLVSYKMLNIVFTCNNHNTTKTSIQTEGKSVEQKSSRIVKLTLCFLTENVIEFGKRKGKGTKTP